MTPLAACRSPAWQQHLRARQQRSRLMGLLLVRVIRFCNRRTAAFANRFVHQLNQEIRMIVTLFRSRLRPEAQTEYAATAPKMAALAAALPGYVSHKQFVATDGERLTLVEFETEAALRVWAAHPEHVRAKRAGRERLFSEYKVQICSLMRESSVPAAA